jgi:xanthine dehydrogenase large subunit
MENFIHESARLHVSGQAVYVDDLLVDPSILSGYIFYSAHPCAKILSYNLDVAAKLEGIHRIICCKDIPGVNQMGPVVKDEPVLAEDKVSFIGQAIFIIVAENEDLARNAAKRIKVDYELCDSVLSLNQAMLRDQKLQASRKIECGNVQQAFSEAVHKFSGSVKTGAQEHWYLETQVALAVPSEANDLKVYSSTQSPAHTQLLIANVLGLPSNKIEVEVKRMGGAFGGKETQANHVAIWASLAAHLTKKSVKICLSREDDQRITGKRHPFHNDYKIAYDEKGKITAFDVQLNSNAGASTDLSMAILERALFHAENSYFVPNFKAEGTAWKTNTPSNTAFRGFGGPQGMFAIENAIDQMARLLKKDSAELRRLNFYADTETQKTPYGQTITHNNLHVIFEKLVASSDYFHRREEIKLFNSSQQYRKRGMALTPVKFGISFTTAFLNQAGALVNIYEDGSVVVNHGGTEMGQGLHTKILAIAATELGISSNKITVTATNTSKIPNTSSTAASSGTDLNGMAVKEAIHALLERIRSFISSYFSKNEKVVTEPQNIVFAENLVFDRINPERKLTFAEVARLCYLNQISLSSTGFHKVSDIYFDRETGTGNPFLYFAYGMAVSEVEIDILTGYHKIRRTDIIQDVGKSINPAIDIGQIEGAFIQGVGWCTIEECKYDTSGNLLNASPDTYKIPVITDIPDIFNVSLLENADNPLAIHGSKAVGEPPFMLAFSVWFAIKDAISAVGDHEIEPDLSIPATNEEIVKSIDKIKAQMAIIR